MKPHDEYKWGVHISGPETLVAAVDFNEAMTKANQINIAFYEDKPDYMRGYYPCIFANVFIWEDKHGEHSPESTDWNDLG